MELFNESNEHLDDVVELSEEYVEHLGDLVELGDEYGEHLDDIVEMVQHGLTLFRPVVTAHKVVL